MILGSTIADDLYRYFGRTDAGACVKAFCRVPAFNFTVWLRVASYFEGRHSTHCRVLYLIFRLFLERKSLKYGYQIPAAAVIGSGLYLGHFGPIIINRAARIGRNVNIAVGAVIGQTNRGARRGSPEIGDCVWIGANAVIVGAIKIGDRALIAPGAYVTFDVPADAVVVGNPGKVVSSRGSEGYIQNIPSARRVEKADDGRDKWK